MRRIAAAAWPALALAANAVVAQQGKVVRLGYLTQRAEKDAREAAFLDGLRPGRNRLAGMPRLNAGRGIGAEPQDPHGAVGNAIPQSIMLQATRVIE